MSPDVPGRYSLDTSAILNAWQRNYPPDLFPTLWRNIEGLIDAGVLIASEEVQVELEKKDDEVHEWAKQRPQMFVPIDGQVQQIVTTILREHPRLIDNRTNRSGADPFVIALAASVGCVVITGERPSGNRTKPKIPDVCQAMEIRCIGIVELIRDQNWIM